MINGLHHFLFRIQIQSAEKLQKYFHPVPNVLIVYQFQSFLFLKNFQFGISIEDKWNHNLFNDSLAKMFAEMSQIRRKEFHESFNRVMIKSPSFLKPQVQLLSKQLLRNNLIAFFSGVQDGGLAHYVLQRVNVFLDDFDVGKADN